MFFHCRRERGWGREESLLEQTVHEFRERLSELWSGANVSNEKLLAQLKQWCVEAEASGIKVLEDFAQRLRSYQLSPA